MNVPAYSPFESEKYAPGDLSSFYEPPVDIVILGDKGTIKNKHGIGHKILTPPHGSGRRQYYLEDVEHIDSASDDSSTNGKQSTLDPLRKLATYRENTQRATTPILIVVQGSGRKKLFQSLRCAHRPSIKGPDSISAILNSIYGIIFLPTPRRRRLLHTFMLVIGQLMCCVVMQNYEVCHGIPKSCQDLWIQDPQPLYSALTPLLEYLQIPSTFLFVLIALIYGVLATLQHHINQTDQLQRQSLLVGIMAGAVISLPSLSRPNKDLALASPLAMCITCALTFSAAVHWFWRTFLNPTQKRLDRTIDQWARETLEVDTKKNAVKFHEIV